MPNIDMNKLYTFKYLITNYSRNVIEDYLRNLIINHGAVPSLLACAMSTSYTTIKTAIPSDALLYLEQSNVSGSYINRMKWNTFLYKNGETSRNCYSGYAPEDLIHSFEKRPYSYEQFKRFDYDAAKEYLSWIAYEYNVGPRTVGEMMGDASCIKPVTKLFIEFGIKYNTHGVRKSNYNVTRWNAFLDKFNWPTGYRKMTGTTFNKKIKSIKEDVHMNEAEMAFREDTKRRNSGAFHHVSGAKSKKCILPSDHKTKKELEAMNGECQVLDLTRIYSWGELQKFSDDLIEMYCNNCIATYSAVVTNLCMALGVNSTVFRKRFPNVGKGPVHRPDVVDQMKWDQFLTKNHVDKPNAYYNFKRVNRYEKRPYKAFEFKNLSYNAAKNYLIWINTEFSMSESAVSKMMTNYNHWLKPFYAGFGIVTSGLSIGLVKTSPTIDRAKKWNSWLRSYDWEWGYTAVKGVYYYEDEQPTEFPKVVPIANATELSFPVEDPIEDDKIDGPVVEEPYISAPTIPETPAPMDVPVATIPTSATAATSEEMTIEVHNAQELQTVMQFSALSPIKVHVVCKF